MPTLETSPYHYGMILLALLLGVSLTLMHPTQGLVLCLGTVIVLIAMYSAEAAIFLLIISMLFSPEFVVGGAVGKGVGGRPVTVRLDDLLLIVIGFAWLVKIIMNKALPVFKWTPANRPILYYILVCVFSTMVGIVTEQVNPRAGFFWVLKYFEFFFLFLMVINHINTKTQVFRYLIVVLAIGFLVSLFAMSQIPSGERVTAPFEGDIGEPNTLGGYLVLMMALVAGLLLYLESIPIRGALAVLMICIVIALLATLSRTSYIAAAVMGFVVLISHWKKPVVLVTVLIATMVIILFLPTVVKDRVGYTLNQVQQSGQVQVAGVTFDTSTSDRIRAWQEALYHWVERPIVGKGVASIWWADAQYVKVLVETGLLGFSAFIFLIVRLWKGAREAFATAQEPWEKGLTYGFLIGIIPLLVHATAANTFSIVRIMEPFWFLAGLVMILPRLKETLEIANPSPATFQEVA